MQRKRRSYVARTRHEGGVIFQDGERDRRHLRFESCAYICACLVPGHTQMVGYIILLLLHLHFVAFEFASEFEFALHV